MWNDPIDTKVSREIEEDWSCFMPDTNEIHATHEVQKINVSIDTDIEILSISASKMTPLDVTNSISGGEYDASCHMIWLGSQLFLDVIFRPLFPPEKTCKDTIRRINNLRNYISNGSEKRILELGSGTGIAGLAFLAASLESRKKSDNPNRPITLILTDSDPAATQLCRRNYERNFKALQYVTFFDHVLLWGDEWWDKDNESVDDTSLRLESFDIVIGTDVVYDLEFLSLFMKTSSEALSRSGLLILSHVPRFAMAEDVESLIIEQAEQYGLLVYEKIRPDILSQSSFYDAFVEKEGVLIVFRRK